jgi:hypothetical protein
MYAASVKEPRGAITSRVVVARRRAVLKEPRCSQTSTFDLEALLEGPQEIGYTRVRTIGMEERR